MENDEIAQLKQLVQSLTDRVKNLEQNHVGRLHSHNGSDSNRINHADTLDSAILAQYPVMAGIGQISGGYKVGGGTVAYPTPFVIGNGAGTYAAFGGGSAPEGALVGFYNTTGPVYQLWLRMNTGWRGIALNLTA